MGNNAGCDVCAGDRSQIDMSRQKATMYERYGRGQMNTRTQMGCDTCGNAGMTGSCVNRGNMRTTGECDTCGNVRITGDCNTCGNMRRMGDRMLREDCGNSHRDELRGMPLAMGYVPWQNFGCTYEPMEGFHAGTIFPELDKPFYGRRGMR